MTDDFEFCEWKAGISLFVTCRFSCCASTKSLLIIPNGVNDSTSATDFFPLKPFDFNWRLFFFLFEYSRILFNNTFHPTQLSRWLVHCWGFVAMSKEKTVNDWMKNYGETSSNRCCVWLLLNPFTCRPETCLLSFDCILSILYLLLRIYLNA